MIEKIIYHNYKVLKAAQLELRRFNLIAGPNGSGKTTLIYSLLQMSELTVWEMEHLDKLSVLEQPLVCESDLRILWNCDDGEQVTIRLPCKQGYIAAGLEITDSQGKPLDMKRRQILWKDLSSVCLLSLEAKYLGRASPKKGPTRMGVRGEGFSRVLWKMYQEHRDNWECWKQEVFELIGEFRDISIREQGENVELWVETKEGVMLSADQLSQGTLMIFALLSLPFAPSQPSVLCIEEVERGIHPRMLREVRDSLYRLAYPEDYDLNYCPVQVILTTQSPYFLDLFNEHPEEVIFSSKECGAGSFKRLSEQPEIGELLKESSIGELWYSGVLGGVPYYR